MGGWSKIRKAPPQKNLNKRIVVTFENFITKVTEIEGILNFRPISQLFSDPNDCQPLTTAHFLVGRPTTSLTETDVRLVPVNRLTINTFCNNISI